MSDPQQHAHNWSFILRIVIKAALLFAAINILFAVFDLTATSGKISLYNGLLTGRERLPYGEDRRAYNLSLNDLDAMFASHRISQPKAADEFRVVIIGDSSVWGILLNNDETLSGQLNQMQLQRDGRTIRAYNIGHPIMSATKDLMLLEIALQHEPDLIVWPLTLASLIRDEQLNPPLLQANAQRIRALIARYDLALDANALPAPSDFWQRSLIAQRRAIADWLRLQLYSVAWTVTGVDQLYGEYTPRSNDFSDDIRWQDYAEPVDYPADVLAFDVVQAAIRLADDVPVLIVNEPIFIADGRNSDVHYNFWYPRWAYDRYRDLLAQAAQSSGWILLDAWDAIAPQEFTDSPVHLTPAGSAQFAALIAQAIQQID